MRELAKNPESLCLMATILPVGFTSIVYLWSLAGDVAKRLAVCVPIKKIADSNPGKCHNKKVYKKFLNPIVLRQGMSTLPNVFPTRHKKHLIQMHQAFAGDLKL